MTSVDADARSTLYEHALRHKNEANTKFSAKAYKDALKSYRAGIDLLVKSSYKIVPPPSSKTNKQQTCPIIHGDKDGGESHDDDDELERGRDDRDGDENKNNDDGDENKNNDDGDENKNNDGDNGEVFRSEWLAKARELLTILYSNSAQCYLDTKKPLRALREANCALALSPLHPKSLFRAIAAVCQYEKGSVFRKSLFYNALIRCEKAIKFLPKEFHHLFIPMYREKLTMRGGIANQPLEGASASFHWLSAPAPHLCYVCRAVPDLSPQGVGSRCPCGAASFCCNAHKEVAFSAEGGHRNFCRILRSEDTTEYLQQTVSQLRNGGYKPDDPTQIMPFMHSLRQAFMFQNNMMPPSEEEYHQMRHVQCCYRCGGYPAMRICEGCSWVTVCADAQGCAKRAQQWNETVSKTTRGHRIVPHSPGGGCCLALQGTARAAHRFWCEPRPQYSYAFNKVDAKSHVMIGIGGDGASDHITENKNAKVIAGVVTTYSPPPDSDMDSRKDNDDSENHPPIPPEHFLERLHAAVGAMVVKNAEIKSKLQQVLEEMKMNHTTLSSSMLRATDIAVLSSYTHHAYRQCLAPYYILDGEHFAHSEKAQRGTKALLCPDDGSFGSGQEGLSELMADTFSWPLTIFYAVMNAPAAALASMKRRLRTTGDGRLVVHVIGAEKESFTTENVWEELLHRFQTWTMTTTDSDVDADADDGSSSTSSHSHLVRHLEVIFIGPQTLGGKKLRELPVDDTLCLGCHQRQFTVRLSTCGRTYEDFVDVEMRRMRKKTTMRMMQIMRMIAMMKMKRTEKIGSMLMMMMISTTVRTRTKTMTPVRPQFQ